jgi:hypothetical protein
VIPGKKRGESDQGGVKNGESSPLLLLWSDVNEVVLNAVLRLKEVDQGQPHVFEICDDKVENKDTEFISPMYFKLTAMLPV